MRVMVIVKADEGTEAGVYPAAAYATRGRFKGEMIDAGILLAGEGLAPSSEGKRISFRPDGSVVDGPFAGGDDLVAGFWILDVDTLDDAVAWVRRAPFDGTSVELRRILEVPDFGGQIPQEVLDAEARRRVDIAARL